MHAAEIASRSTNQADDKILDRLEECLSSSVIDLRASTDLVLSDGLLLAYVLRAAENYGECTGLTLSDCIVICGSPRLLHLCNVLKQKAAPVLTNSKKLGIVVDRHHKSVCSTW